MSEQAHPAGVPETQTPSVDAAPNASPPGGDQTQQADPSASEWWETSDGRKTTQDKLWRRAYNEGTDTGTRRAETSILARFNVDSFDALEAKLNGNDAQPQPGPKDPPVSPAVEAQPPSTGDDPRDEIIRELKAELESVKAITQKSEELAQQHKTSLDRSLRSELAAKFASLGALPDAINDLAELTLPNVRWTPDGDKIEVIEKQSDNSVIPSRLTLDEYVKTVSEQKRYFFATNGAQGSGSQPPVRHIPANGVPTVNSSNFTERIEAYKKRPRR
jgi:hypothetical protein